MGGDGSSSSTGDRVRESSLMWPMLTRSNYSEWAMLMQCNYETLEIWETIEPGGEGVKRAQDRQAMGGLLRSVPKEMWARFGAKKTVKEARAAVKSMRLGLDRVKEACPKVSLVEFENIAFKDGEMVDDFALRINALAEELRGLGESIDDARVVKKMLRVLQALCPNCGVHRDICWMSRPSIEDPWGRRKAAEDRFEVDSVTERTGRLMLSEEEWLSKYRHRLILESSSSGGGEKQGGYNPAKQKGGGRGEKEQSEGDIGGYTTHRKGR
ncbi:unnamed protein product [Miscanthus lutarioriparius]|uniref:DUF4219 domain-containing protein n=1 Tax=Miscanthus lutarioriparius TaxID=422564 RepID=A0A811RZZ2_9POAL|nr:unnamed protein product [Miscanthus lutarioriparius]